MLLTILMPCLNEVETLETCISKAKGWLTKSGVPGEILIADNGSSDGSQELAQRLGARVISVAEKGYGAALFNGALAAVGEFIIMGDADDSYDFSDLDAFWLSLKNGSDLVMGNRFLGGIKPGAMPWKNRYIGNPILSWIGKLLFKCPAGDFHCGLRGFRKDALIRMDLRTSGMEFASEMVIKANLMGMRIAEVPTTLSPDGRSRPPHLKPWRDGWRHLKFMLLFSPRWLLFYPGVAVFFLSMILYGLSIVGPTSLFFLSIDVNTMFFSATGMVVGAIALVFGILVRLFGAREGLLSDTQIIQKIRRSAAMEIGLLVGIGIVVIGLSEVITLIIDWGRLDFGDLEKGAYLRRVSIAALTITLGSLMTLTSLVIGYLSLPLRRPNQVE